jgi:hypothetical protein
VGRNIESIYVTKTYGGFMEGTYEAANDCLRKNVINRTIKQMWGERETLVFWPDGDPKKKWPEYTYYVYLDEPSFGSSMGPDDFDGSELVVVWFSGLPVDEIQYDLNELLTDELWKKHSKGYQY